MYQLIMSPQQLHTWLAIPLGTKVMNSSHMLQALKQNGVEKFSPLGDKFDPNVHSALFQIPDADKDAGTVVVVTKVICSVCCCKDTTIGCAVLSAQFSTRVQKYIVF